LDEIALVEQLVPGSATCATVAGSNVALFNVNGRLFATDDACVRCASSLAKGRLEGHVVACGTCGWQYDVTTGCVAGLPGMRINRFQVKIVDAHTVLEISPLPYR